MNHIPMRSSMRCLMGNTFSSTSTWPINEAWSTALRPKVSSIVASLTNPGLPIRPALHPSACSISNKYVHNMYGSSLRHHLFITHVSLKNASWWILVQVQSRPQFPPHHNWYICEVIYIQIGDSRPTRVRHPEVSAQGAFLSTLWLSNMGSIQCWRSVGGSLLAGSRTITLASTRPEMISTEESTLSLPKRALH